MRVLKTKKKGNTDSTELRRNSFEEGYGLCTKEETQRGSSHNR